MRKIALFAAIACALSSISCATAHHVLVPDVASMTNSKQDFSSISLYITRFEIKNKTEADLADGDSHSVMLGALKNYIESKSKYKNVIDATLDSSIIDKADEYLTLQVQIEPSHTEKRLWYLDIWFFYPFVGYWPFTPQWGVAKVTLTYNLMYKGNLIGSEKIENQNKYYIPYYSHYQKKNLEREMKRMYESTYEEFSKLLADDVLVYSRSGMRNDGAVRETALFEDSANIPSLAIFDLKSNSASRNEMEIIEQLIGAKIHDTRKFRIIETGMRDKALEEIEFSISDVGSREDQLKVGKMLSAQKILMSSLEKDEVGYTLSMQLIDVQTTLVEATYTKSYSSIREISDRYKDFVARIAP